MGLKTQSLSLSLVDVQRHLKLTPLEWVHVSLFSQASLLSGEGVRAKPQHTEV